MMRLDKEFARFLNVCWPKDLPKDCMNPEADCIIDDKPITCNPCAKFGELARTYEKIQKGQNEQGLWR